MFYPIFSRTSCFHFYTNAPAVSKSQAAIRSFITSGEIKSREREQQREIV